MIEVFTRRRDESFLRFPVFQTDARFDHQMSGSPIVSSPVGAPEVGAQRVVGLVSSSVDFGDAALGHTSYGSLLWPAAALHLPYLNDSGTEVEKSLLDLATAGGVDVDTTAELTVNQDDWSVTRTWTS